MSQDEVISLKYSSPLQVIVRVSAYFFKYESSLLLKEFSECAIAMSLGKLFHGVAILLKRKCVLGLLPDVRLRES